MSKATIQVKGTPIKKDTFQFLSAWELLNNPKFNSLEFEGIKKEAFYHSAKKWADVTNSTGLIATAGRYGGTFAHKEIAFRQIQSLSKLSLLYTTKEVNRV